MRIGRMDRELTLLRRVETGTDSLNAPVFELQTVTTVWAEKIHRREDEEFDAESRQRYAVRRVIFRTFWIDLNAVDALECDGFRYDIKGFREIGYQEGIEISAEWQD